MKNNFLNKKEIELLLPHREPMLLVDKLINIVPLKSATGILNVKTIRHLATLKRGSGAAAGAGVLALMASGAGFAPAAAGPTAHALAAGLGSGIWFQVM